MAVMCKTNVDMCVINQVQPGHANNSVTLLFRKHAHARTRSPRTFEKSRSCVTNASALIDKALAT